MKIETQTKFWDNEEWQDKTDKILLVFTILFAANGAIAVWQNRYGSLIISIIGISIYAIINRSYIKWKKEQRKD